MIFLFLVSSLSAGIFGEDSRFEGYAESTPKQFELARSTPALVRSSQLVKQTDGSYQTLPRKSSDLNFCEGVRFEKQHFLANCSASLIAPDLVLTAAHCIESNGTADCDQFKVVFDFAEGEGQEILKASQVYDCKKVEYFKFDLPVFKEDLAIIRLNRKVEDRRPIELDLRVPKLHEELEMMGYPLGLPLKGVDDGKVNKLNPSALSFQHDLDTFSCNSGGPVFSKEGKQIGVLVRGTSPNLDRSAQYNCYDWGKAKKSDYAEANTLIHLDQILMNLRIK